MQVRRRSAKCDVDCDVQRGIIAVRSTSLNTTACQTAARACDAVVCVLCLHKPRHQKVTLVLHGGDLSSVIGSCAFPLSHGFGFSPNLDGRSRPTGGPFGRKSGKPEARSQADIQAPGIKHFQPSRASLFEVVPKASSSVSASASAQLLRSRKQTTPTSEITTVRRAPYCPIPHSSIRYKQARTPHVLTYRICPPSQVPIPPYGHPQVKPAYKRLIILIIVPHLSELSYSLLSIQKEFTIHHLISSQHSHNGNHIRTPTRTHHGSAHSGDWRGIHVSPTSPTP